MTLVFVPTDGLGNLLFQHNAAYSFAKENNLELCAPGWYYDRFPKFGEYAKLFKHVKILGEESDGGGRSGLNGGSSAQHIFHPPQEFFMDPERWRILNALRFSPVKNVYVERGHTYKPIPKDARVISGYFQSWKYFDKFRIEIRDLLFANETELHDLKKEKHATLSEGKPTVCVHIRRGDYAKNPTIHPMCDQEYYTKAINEFSGKYKFLVFAENIEEIRKWNVWSDLDVHFVDDEPLPLDTLFLMALCHNFIIANSSLSLMAYYMRQNEDARLIFPKDWFGPGGPRFNIEDIVKT